MPQKPPYVDPYGTAGQNQGKSAWNQGNLGAESGSYYIEKPEEMNGIRGAARYGVEQAEQALAEARSGDSSAAQQQLRLGLSQAQRGMAQQAVGRGSNPLAQRSAIYAGAQAAGQMNAQSAMLRAQEMQAARQQQLDAVAREQQGYTGMSQMELQRGIAQSQNQLGAAGVELGRDQWEFDKDMAIANAIMSGVGTMAGAMSDENLKQNIQPVDEAGQMARALILGRTNSGANQTQSMANDVAKLGDAAQSQLGQNPQMPEGVMGHKPTEFEGVGGGMMGGMMGGMGGGGGGGGAMSFSGTNLKQQIQPVGPQMMGIHTDPTTGEATTGMMSANPKVETIRPASYTDAQGQRHSGRGMYQKVDDAGVISNIAPQLGGGKRMALQDFSASDERIKKNVADAAFLEGVEVGAQASGRTGEDRGRPMGTRALDWFGENVYDPVVSYFSEDAETWQGSKAKRALGTVRAERGVTSGAPTSRTYTRERSIPARDDVIGQPHVGGRPVRQGDPDFEEFITMDPQTRTARLPRIDPETGDIVEHHRFDADTITPSDERIKRIADELDAEGARTMAKLGSVRSGASTADQQAAQVGAELEREDDKTLASLRGYTYEYKPEAQAQLGLRPGKRFGIMAQDVASTPLGSTMVVETPAGLAIDNQAAHGAELALLGRLAQRDDEIREEMRVRDKLMAQAFARAARGGRR